MLRRSLLAAVLMALLSPSLLAEPADPTSPIMISLADGQFADAATACEQARKTPKLAPERLALIDLLHGRALVELGKLEQAAKLAERVAASQTAWSARGHYLAAEILIAQGKHAAAAARYRAQYATVAGAKASAALAGRFRALAKAAAAGERPDLGRAAALYLEAARSAEDALTAAPDRISHAAALQTSGNLRGAISAWQVVLEIRGLPAASRAQALHHRGLAHLGRKPDGSPAVEIDQRTKMHLQRRLQNNQQELVRALQAQLEMQRRRHMARSAGGAAQGRADLREVSEKHAKSPYAPTALLYLGGNLALSGRYAPAISCWRGLLERYADSKAAPSASVAIARCLEQMAELDDAIAGYDAHIKRFPKHASAGQAAFRAANCALRRGRYADAERRLTDYLRAYPTGSFWQAARSQLEETRFQSALALTDKQTAVDKASRAKADAALAAYLEGYPTGTHAGRAHMLRGLLAAADGDHERAELHWRTVIARMPKTPAARQAQLAIAAAAEERGDLAKAVAMLDALVREQGNTSEGRSARTRRDTLRRTELTVRSPRPFRSAEGAKLEIFARNLPALEVLVYKLDLVSHLRKHRSLSQVHNIATEIVAPTHKLVHEIGDYARFRPYRFELPLPVEGSGAWVVEVRTAQTRSKTLVIKSDLEMVVRATPEEALLMVEREGKAAEGVSLLAMHPGGELGETKTDAEGLAKLDLTGEPGERQPQRMAVVAFDGEQLAYASLQWGLRKAAKAPAPKGYVYTDRPLYRPGDAIHFRGLIRSIDGTAFTTPAGGKVDVVVTDARGMICDQQQLELDAFGAVAGEVTLADEPALGRYQIAINLPRESGVDTFLGEFFVEEYTKPAFEVALETKQRVLFAGEEMVVELDARYPFGGAVANARVSIDLYEQGFSFDRARYQDFSWFFKRDKADAEADGPRLTRATLTTDKDGRATWRYRLPEGRGERRLVAVATVVDAAGQYASGGTSALAVHRGVMAILTPDRKVYRPKERAQLRLVTVLPDHRPVALEGTLEISRRVGKQWQPVGEQKVATDEHGRAKLSAVPQHAGRHRVVFRGRDRAGNPINATATLDVAGDDGSTELAIRAEKPVYRQGEKALVHLSTPAPGMRVLVTFEADKILHHQIVQVEGRATTFELEMLASFAPNGYLTAAALHDNQLFTSVDALSVIEYLDVTVKARDGKLAPGQSTELEIITRDQKGAPISAAVSCAVVDSQVLQLKSDPAGEIKSVFYGHRRAQRIQPFSSAFSHDGKRFSPLTQLTAELKHREERSKSKAMLDEVERQQGQYGGRMDRRARGGAMRPAESPAMDGKFNNDALGASGGERAELAKEADKAFEESKGLHSLQESLRSVRKLEQGYKNSKDMTSLGAGAAFKLRRQFADTALWVPSVTTDAKGRATVQLNLPDNITRWQVSVRGASQGNHVGMGGTQLVSSQPLLIKTRMPAYLIEKDRAEGTVEIHNATASPATVGVGLRQRELQAEAGELVPDRQMKVTARGVGRAPLPLVARRPGEQVVEAIGAAGPKLGDRLNRSLLVLPSGTKVLRAGAGRLASSARRKVALPPYTDRRDARLLIGVDPDPDRSLEGALDELRRFPYGCFEQTVSRFLPAVAAIHAYRAMGRPNDRLEKRFIPMAKMGLARVYAMQRPDGSWGWWQRGNRNGTMTAYGLLCLELCRASQVVEVLPQRLQRARNAARALFSRVDTTTRALLAYGLSFGAHQGSRDARLISSLVRAREQLGDASLALGALAALRLGDEAGAQPLLDLLRQRGKRDGSGLVWKGDGGFLSGEIESTALATLALAHVGQTERDRVRAGADALLARRHGAGWGSTKASAFALLAMAKSRALLAEPVKAYTVTVKVNGKQAGSFEVGPGSKGRHVLNVASELLQPENDVVFDKKGEGTLYFWYRLEGFRRGKVSPAGHGMQISRSYRHAADPASGATAEVPGQSCIEPERRERRPVVVPEEVAIGDLLRVELTVRCEQDANYVMIEDPRPAGTAVDRRSLKGSHDRHEVRLDRTVFFFTRLRRGVHRISYQVRALYPGVYSANPARCEQMYEPTSYAHGASHKLTIVRELAAEQRKLSPDARLAAAHAHFRAGRAKQAEAAYLALLSLPLRTPIAAQISANLLALRAEAGGAGLLAAYERYRQLAPGAALGQGGALSPKLLGKVADAYVASDKGTEALELYRILFDRQLAVLGRLASAHRAAGQPRAAQAAAGEGIQQLPATPNLVASRMAWAAAYEQTPAASAGDTGLKAYDEALRELLLQQALWPSSPTTRLAARRMIELAGRLGHHKLAASRAVSYLERYQRDRRADVVLRQLAEAAFNAGQTQLAAQSAARLAKATMHDGRRLVASPHRGYGLYIQGKLAHAAGDLAAAVGFYRQVQHSYPDAAATVRFYERRVLEVDGVVRVKLDGEAKLPLRYRNIRKLDIALYKVDLLTLFMIRGGRGTMSGVDLAGIKPTRRLARELPAAEGLSISETEVKLGELEPGAYWVVGRADDREVSAFVLKSDIELKVQVRNGRVHVHAFRNGKPAPDVQVRVAGQGAIQARGKTDARGLFSHAVRGNDLAVIAFANGRYALWSK